MEGQHVPVLLDKVIEYLQPQPGENFIDATIGGGGHARAILNKIAPDGRLLAIDLDQSALTISRKNFKNDHERVVFINNNFAKLKQIYDEQFSLHKINGILLDLGLSSIGLQSEDRGFSFQLDGRLDMRFDQRQSLTAAEMVNTWPFDKLKKVIQEYGQETPAMAREVVKNIILARQNSPITKTKKLVEAILLAFRNKLKSKKEIPWVGGLHPATKTFQALRMAVNDELGNLAKSLPQAVDILAVGGRLAVISFHSLEDKIVKNFFRQASRDCLCPPEFPVCRCGHQASVKIITKRPVRPDPEELKKNPRSRSALLRVAEKV